MKRYVIFIWGTGTVADWIISQCDILEYYNVLGFIDDDIAKVGKKYKNYKIYSPDILEKICPDKIIVLSDFYENIKTQIIKKIPYMKEIIENKYFFHKEILLKRYENTGNEEINTVLEYIKNNDLDVFNYEFKKKYMDLEIRVFFDEIYNLFFVFHENRKLYFAKSYDTKEKVRNYYRTLLVEQDEKSPHRYLTSDFNVKKGDVVVDVGVAEGNFALGIIEEVSKIYLIETDDEWIEAINATFKDYQEKIVIIKKCISSIDMGNYATLDNLINEPINFIKMDIEGDEWDALIGAKKLFERSNNLKCAICAYHQESDEVLLRDILYKYGLSCSTTKGYMWFPYSTRQKILPTKLCRGVVRGEKNKRR